MASYADEFLEDNTPTQAIAEIKSERSHAKGLLKNLKTDASRADDKASFLTKHKAQMKAYRQTIRRASEAIKYLKTKKGGRRPRTGKSKTRRRH